MKLRATSDRGRLCGACYARATRVECSRCKAFQPPNARDPEGRPICHTCVRRERAATEVAVMRARISSVVRGAEPELDEAAIDVAVAVAGHNLR